MFLTYLFLIVSKEVILWSKQIAKFIISTISIP